jgi:hypothetical protein
MSGLRQLTGDRRRLHRSAWRHGKDSLEAGEGGAPEVKTHRVCVIQVRGSARWGAHLWESSAVGMTGTRRATVAGSLPFW